MSIDPDEELRRIEAKYAATSPRDFVLVVVGVALGFVLVRLVWDVDLWFLVGVVLGFAGWELTKFRLRRNARGFSRSEEGAS